MQNHAFQIRTPLKDFNTAHFYRLCQIRGVETVIRSFISIRLSFTFKSFVVNFLSTLFASKQCCFDFSVAIKAISDYSVDNL